MAPNKRENGTQRCFSKFDCRLFIYEFLQFAFYLSLSFSVISLSPAQPCCKCYNLSVCVALNVWFTMNGMCMKNNTHIYVARTSRTRISTTCDFYRCLLSWCAFFRTCHSDFPIATKFCCDQDVKMVPGATFKKECAIGAVRCKKEGMLLKPLSWCCIDCAIHHERDVR